MRNLKKAIKLRIIQILIVIGSIFSVILGLITELGVGIILNDIMDLSNILEVFIFIALCMSAYLYVSKLSIDNVYRQIKKYEKKIK